MRNTKYRQMISKLLLISFCCLLPVTAFAQTVNDKKLTAREIAKQTLPSVVLLVMGNSKTETAKSGSGFFVTEDIVATNFHVIKDTDEGVVKIIGQDKLYDVLGVVGVDEKNDLALLKIKGIKGKPLTLNKDDSTAIGDEVFAVGNPKGLEGTFSQGIVSSIRKSEKINLLQITASISEGSSGGAVLNDAGEVIGVAIGAIQSGQSLNFAIPISMLRSLLISQKPIKTLANTSVSIAKNTSSIARNESDKPKGVVLFKPTVPKNSPLKVRAPELVSMGLSGSIGAIESVKEEFYTPKLQFGEWKIENPQALKSSKYNLDGYETSSEIIFNKESIVSYMLGHKEDYGFPSSLTVDKSYDFANGSVIEKIFVKCSNCASSKLESQVMTKYEDNGIAKYDKDGKLTEKTVKVTDQNGKQTITYYNGDGTTKFVSINYKTNVGKIWEWWKWSDQLERVFLEFKSVSTEKETKDGTESQIIDYRQGKETDRRTFLFSKGKRLPLQSTSTLLFNDGTVMRNVRKNEYEFDSYGNWIKKTDFEQVTKFGKIFFEPTLVTIRRIHYY
ncbi:MAG: serine protease [Acidobacteria bacterium]|nr:serine protease [Acidobacteriota bacterium]